MRVLLLGINYFPEPVGIAVYTTGLAEFLAHQGHDVTIVTTDPYYPAWRVQQRMPRHSVENGVTILRVPIYVPARPSGLKRILHHVSFAVRALPVLLKEARLGADVVFTVAPSLVSAPVGKLAARIGGARSWLHVQDFEVEAAIQTGLLPEGSKLAGLAHRFESIVLKRFDRVSSICGPMIARLQDKGVARECTFELRNWADLSNIQIQTKSSFRQIFGINRPYVALYSGNIGNKQGIEIIPEVARLLRRRDDVEIVICGEGAGLKALKAQAAGLDNIQFHPLQPKEKLGELLALADIHLLPQIAGAADLLLPSKLTNMLASGRPVIATAADGTGLAAEVEGVGLVVPPEDASAMAFSVEKLLDDHELRERLGIAARQRAVERWDGVQVLRRFDSALCELTGLSSPGDMPAELEDD